MFFAIAKRKVAYDVIRLARKTEAKQKLYFMLERYRRTPTFEVILKTTEKLIINWNELLLVCYSKTNKLNQKRFD